MACLTYVLPCPPPLQYELQILARLFHPNVVRVFGGSLRPPNLFVVEEVLCKDLAGHIHKRGAAEPPLTLPQVLAIAIDIVRGLVSATAGMRGVLQDWTHTPTVRRM